MVCYFLLIFKLFNLFSILFYKSKRIPNSSNPTTMIHPAGKNGIK